MIHHQQTINAGKAVKRRENFTLGGNVNWYNHYGEQHSVHFSLSVVSNPLWPHGLEHTRFPCPSPTPGVHSNSRPSSLWWHPAISSSVIPFSSCLQSFLASESFPMSQFFASGSQNWSFSFSISPSNEYSGLISFRTDWLDPLAVQGSLKRLLQHHSSKASILQHSAFFIVQLSHPYTTTGKTIALTRWTFVGEQNGGCLENYAAIIWPCNPTRAYNICGEKHGLKGYCTPMFITALSTIAKTRKQPKCPWTEERIKMGTYTPWNITRP